MTARARTAAQITTAERLDHLVTEKQLQDTIIEIAGYHGWDTFHVYDSRRSQPGWPDLVLMKPPQLVFVELKREDGKVTAQQARVLEMLEACTQEVHVWRPSQLDDIVARLSETP